MNAKPSYQRIVMTLGEARRDASKIGDYVLEALLCEIQAIAVDRVYGAFDQSDSRSTGRPLGKRRQRVLQ
jgi:hypothetical protein